VFTKVWIVFRSFIADYFVLFTPEYFVIVNEAGIHCLAVYKKRAKIVLSSEIPSNDKDLYGSFNNFFAKLKTCSEYLGQSLIILIGGNFAFHLIKDSRAKLDINLNEVIEPDKCISAFRPLQGKDGKRYIFFGGIRKDIYELPFEALKRHNLKIACITPITYFISKQLLNNKIFGKSIIMLPGQINEAEIDDSISIMQVPINFKPNLESIINSDQSDESSGSNKANEFGLTTNSKEPNIDLISKLFYPKLLRNRYSGELFKPSQSEKIVRLMNTVREGLRLASLLLLVLCFLSIVSATILDKIKGSYEKSLSEYSTEYHNISTLRREIARLNTDSANLKKLGYGQTNFTGAISAFCQERPAGLQVLSIDIFNNDPGKWELLVSGIASSEKDVFKYRDYTSRYLAAIPLEISQLNETRIQKSRISDQSKTYNFKLHSQLTK